MFLIRNALRKNIKLQKMGIYGVAQLEIFLLNWKSLENKPGIAVENNKNNKNNLYMVL